MDPLATVDDLEDWLGTTVAPGPADLALEGVSQAVRDYCGWHVAPSVTETVTYDGPAGRVLLLRSLHVTELTEIRQLDTADAGLTWEYLTVDPTLYTWSTDGRVKCSGDGWWTSRYQGLQVDLTHGFDPVPANVRLVVLSAVARTMQSPAGVVREQVGNVAVTYTQTGVNQSTFALLDVERAALNRYVLEVRV